MSILSQNLSYSQDPSKSQEELNWDNEKSKQHIASLRAYQENLITRLELSSKEQEPMRKTISELNQKDQNAEKLISTQNKELLKLKFEYSELQQTNNSLDDSLNKKTEETKDLTENIKQNQYTQQNIWNISNTSTENFESEELSTKNNIIQKIQASIIKEQEIFDINNQRTIKDYEKTLRIKKNEAKFAKFLEGLKYRSISLEAKADSLVTNEKLENDLHVINENNEIYQKNIAWKMHPAELISSKNFMNTTIISEQSPLLLKMKYMILIIIGYLLYDILYNNIKGYYT